MTPHRQQEQHQHTEKHAAVGMRNGVVDTLFDAIVLKAKGTYKTQGMFHCE